MRVRALPAEGLLLVVVVIWGTNFAILKAVLGIMHPHVLNLFRLSMATVFLGLIYMRQQRHEGASFFEPLRTHAIPIVLLGLLGFVVYQFLFILGLDLTTAGNAALIMTSAPLWTGLIGRMFKLEYLTKGAWLGLWLSLIGTLIVVASGAERVALGNGTWLGNLVVLFAALAWSAYTSFSKPVVKHVSPVGLTFLGLLVALPCLIAIAWPFADSIVWAQLTPGTWLALAYSGLLSSGLAIVWWNASIKSVGAARTAIYGNLVPLVAMLTSYVVLDEKITAAQLIGGVLIIGGLIWMRRS